MSHSRLPSSHSSGSQLSRSCDKPFFQNFVIFSLLAYHFDLRHWQILSHNQVGAFQCPQELQTLGRIQFVYRY